VKVDRATYVLLTSLRNCAICGVKLTKQEKHESVSRYETLLCKRHQQERAEGER